MGFKTVLSLAVFATLTACGGGDPDQEVVIVDNPLEPAPEMVYVVDNPRTPYQEVHMVKRPLTSPDFVGPPVP